MTAKGRERTYVRHFSAKERPVPRGCVDATLELDSFAEILREDVQRRLLDESVLFVANRSFEVYLRQKYDYDEIERRMLVPFFGNRYLLRAEEREGGPSDQYALLRKAGIRHPRQFASPGEIDGSRSSRRRMPA